MCSSDLGSLEALLEKAATIKQPKRRESLTDPESVARVRVSKELVALKRDVPLEVPLEDLALQPPGGKTLVAFVD